MSSRGHGNRSASGHSAAVCFLLEEDDVSALHYYAGAPFEIHVVDGRDGSFPAVSG